MLKKLLIALIIGALTGLVESWWGSSGVHQEGIINTLVEKSDLSNSDKQELAIKLVIRLLEEMVGLLRGIMAILGVLLLGSGVGYVTRLRRGLPPQV